jgi:hypothetical protein
LNYQGPSCLPPSLSQTLVAVDFNRYSQVLRNIISNALKFTPPGGKINIQVSEQSQNITIPYRVRSETLFSTQENGAKSWHPRESSLSPDSQHAEYLRIDISDTGTGMTKVPPWSLAPSHSLSLSLSQAQQESLFKGVVQFEDLSASNANGAGLGLWSEFPSFSLPASLTLCQSPNRSSISTVDH